MPNYKFTDNLKADLKREAQRLLQIPVDAVRTDFPLTLEQVLTATVPALAREWIAGLEAMKVDSLNTDRQRLALVESDEITHTVLLDITLPKHAIYLWNTQQSSFAAMSAFQAREKNPALAAQIPFDIDTLDEGTRTKFVAWVNTVTKQTRLAYAAKQLIDRFFDDHCNSTAELLARWNGLKILFARQADPWPGRIRNVPHRGLHNWSWSAAPTISLEWAVENDARIKAVSGLLAGAALMDTSMSSDTRNNIVRANILSWDGKAHG